MTPEIADSLYLQIRNKFNLYMFITGILVLKKWWQTFLDYVISPVRVLEVGGRRGGLRRINDIRNIKI